MGGRASGTDSTPFLLPHHHELIRASAIGDEVAAARGWPLP